MISSICYARNTQQLAVGDLRFAHDNLKLKFCVDFGAKPKPDNTVVHNKPLLARSTTVSPGTVGCPHEHDGYGL